MIVVDTNVIAALYLTSDFTAQAESLILQDADWTAPSLWRSEMRNTLTKYLHAGLMSLEQVYQIQHQAEVVMTGNEYQTNSLEVLKLASTSQCSAYDCEFIALARYLQVKLITQDKQILAQFPQDTIALKDIEIKPL
jgi:predicted nucleic acid-binding protein